MSFLVEMVKSVVVIILVASFLEMLLPNSSVRPFVRFAIGLFVMIAILNPVLKFVHKTGDLKVDAWDMKWEDARTQEVKEQGERLRQQILQKANQQVKSKIEGQVGALAGLVPGVQHLKTEVELDASGGINGLVLVVDSKAPTTESEAGEIRVFSQQSNGNASDRKVIERKLVELIKNLYGVDPSRVEVKFEGG